MKRTFSLGAILSVTTRILACPPGDLYAILKFMTNDQVFTHQLIRVADECKPYLLRQLPWLVSVDDEGVNPENWQMWYAGLIAQHEEWHEVSQIPQDDHDRIDPMDEAERM